MSFKQRRIIFWSFVAIFIVGAAYAVLYSSGWRLNTKTFVFEKTGGIYIKSQPIDVLITIDRKSQKSKTGLIFYKGTLFANLSHKKYNIKVSKDGFWEWSKKLDVEPLFVTQATHIILLPKEPKPSEVFSFPKSFDKIFYSPSYDYFLVKFNFEKETSLFVFNAKNNSFKLIYQTTEEEWKKIAGNGGDLNIKWSPNEKMFILTDYAFSVGGENTRPLNIRKEFYNLLAKKIGSKKSGVFKIEEILWHPFLENSFLFKVSYPVQLLGAAKTALSTSTSEKFNFSSEKAGKSFYMFNFDKKELAEILDLTESKNEAVCGSGIYWIDVFDRLFHFNLISKNHSLLYPVSAPTSSQLRSISEPDLIISGNHDFIAVISQGGGALYIFDASKNELYRPMHSGVKKVIFSPDNKKLAVLENDFLKIIYLTDFYDDFIKKRGDIGLIGKYPDIKDFFWHSDSNHLWVKTAEKLQLVEIDARDKINSMDLQNVDSGADVFLKDNGIYSVDPAGIRQYKIFE